MANCMVFHTQLASIMEVLANSAVAEICKLVDDDYAVFRLEITQSQKENRALRRKLQLLELKVARERVFASRPSSVKILDRYRGMARGEGHRSGGHRSFVKPAEHNSWRDDQPIAIDEGSGTSTQHVIVIESTEAAGPGVKQERTEGEEDSRHSRDIQTGAVAGVLIPVAMEDLATAVVPQARPRRSITEVSGTPNTILKSLTDTETLTVTHRLLHTGSHHRSDPERLGLGPLGCPTAPGSEYVPVFYQSQRTVHSCGDGDTLDTGGDDLSCSYTTEMDPGNISLGLETQTDLSRGDWNQYSSSVYSEGCLDKKGEVIVIDEVTVKVEGDAPLTWNADETHSGEGHSQGRDFLDYRESLETNSNVAINSPCPQKEEIHQRVHTGVKSFSCTQCHMRFAQAGDLKRHQRVHTGVKPFSCTQCHMRFAQAGNLKRHQRVHTGEKPFSCPQCEKRFSRHHQLKMHLKVHTGERPFACTHCSKRFSERSYLRIHQQKKHSTLI